MFNRKFNIPDETPFKYNELEEALLERFHSVKIAKYGNIDDSGSSYSIECKEYFGSYEYESDFCSTKELAMEDLFIKYKDDKEIREIVNNVYGLER